MALGWLDLEGVVELRRISSDSSGFDWRFGLCPALLDFGGHYGCCGCCCSLLNLWCAFWEHVGASGFGGRKIIVGIALKLTKRTVHGEWKVRRVSNGWDLELSGKYHHHNRAA